MLAQPSQWTPTDEQVRKVLSDQRRVIPFLGAGMTLACGLPDTPSLVKALQGGELGAGVSFEPGAGLTETFDTLAEAHSLEAVQDVCAAYITDLSEGAPPAPTFPYLVQVPSRWIVTLSYDLLLERAATEAGRPVRSVTWNDTADLADLRFSYVDSSEKTDELIIFHLHGSVADPRTIVADRTQYQDVGNATAVRALLTALMSNHRTCWMGCRIDEPHLIELLASLSNGQATHCFISDQEAIDAVRRGPRAPISRRQHGMAFDGFPTGRWECLTEFCEWLVTKPAISSAPLTSGDVPSGLGPFTGVVPGTKYVWSDWGPEWTRKALKELGTAAPDELALLQQVLTERSVEELAAMPPPWLADGSWQLWIAVARFAEEHGNWSLASTAWETAGQRPGADTVRCLSSASVAAETGGDEGRAATITQQARKLDPEHPRIRLLDAHEDAPDAETLVKLEGLFDEPGDVGTLALCHAVITCLRMDDLANASRFLDAAEDRDSDLMQVRLARVNYVVHQGRHRFSASERADARALQTAKEDALTIRDQLLPQRRYRESCRLIMLAADAAGVQGDLEAAAELLQIALPEELEAEDARMVLADAALRAQARTAALELLEPVEQNVTVDAMRAQAQIHSTDESVRAAARTRLEEIFDAGEDDHARERAAHILLGTAPDFPDLPFPEAASSYLIEQGDTRGSFVARALWLHSIGRPDEARALTRAHEPARWAYEVGLQIALEDDDIATVVQLADRVLTDSDDPTLRLVCARQFAAAGRLERSREVATALATDESAPTWARAEAFMQLAYLLIEREGDHQEGLEWLRRWSDAIPDDRRHVWGRIQSHLRLGQREEAIAMLLGSGLAIESRSEAQLAANTYFAMPDRKEGLRRLADLRDALTERDPEIDKLAWFGLVDAGSELPEELAERLQPPPEFEIPGRRLSLREARDLLRAQRQTVDAVRADMRRGESAVTRLAHVAGRALTALWLELDSKPAGFGTSDWDKLDEADAQHALTRGVVVDPTALVSLTLLPDPTRETALRKLLAPMRVAQSSLDDINEAVLAASSPGTPFSPDAQTGEPLPVSEPEPHAAERAAALRAIHELALRQRVEPDLRNDQPSRLDEMLNDQAMPTCAKALTASLALAERTGRPLFTDDRVARRMARQLGIPAFGTAALLHILVNANALTTQDRVGSVTVLRGHGYHGLRVIDGELQSHIDKGWNTQELRQVVQDPLLWDAAAIGQFVLSLEILHRAHARNPATFDTRVGLVVDWLSDAMTQIKPFRARGQYLVDLVAELLHTVCLILTSERVAPGIPALYDGIERYARGRTAIPAGQLMENAHVWLARFGVELSLTAFVQMPLRRQFSTFEIDASHPTSRALTDRTLAAALSRVHRPKRRSHRRPPRF